MKAVVLAGGFAKRMGTLTENQPKQLLDIAGRPMLEYVLDKVLTLPELEKVYISTNAKFKDHFEKFIGSYIGCPPYIELELLIEPVLSEEKKLGSVGALGYLISEKKIDSDFLVIGGDNLFDFNLEDVMQYYRKKKSNVLVVYDVETLELARIYGIVTLNENDKIVKFTEKSDTPEGTLASTACYFFTPDGVKMITRYIEEGNNADTLGYFIEWLIQQTTVYGYVHRGSWFDIGSRESYDEANEYYKTHK
jgi:glucose-1-phosphate thymidylyltransferase